ncbi:MAG: hypothetical protein E7478_01235 [Ruminococcaceae bacterium]|nr:hypothetical protein [Oscillospiraceae bacterium]
MYSLIGKPLGYILYFIYEIGITNIGVAIILFTFIVKLAMLPLSIKQQKATAKSAIFAPKVKEIQTKYRNNQEKQQQELQKLQQQGYNPMSGCGTMILTFLLLFGVLDVVYKPMTHILHTDEENINEMIEEGYSIQLASIIVDQHNVNIEDLKGDDLTKHEEIVRDAAKILEYYNANLKEGQTAKDATVWNTLTNDTIEVVTSTIKSSLEKEYAIVKANNKDNGKEVLFTSTDLFTITDYARTDEGGNTISSEKEEMSALKDNDKKAEYRKNHAFSESMTSVFKTMQSQYGYWHAEKDGDISFVPSKALQRELYVLESFGTVKNGIEYKHFYTSVHNPGAVTDLYDNLTFIGIKLGQVPKDNLGFPMILVPILAFLLSLLQTFIMNKNMENNGAGSMGNGMKITMYIMPVFSLFFVFSVPAGAGFYWTISYVFGIAQSLILNKLYNPVKLRAQAEAEYNERMKIIETQAKKVRDTDRDETISEYNGEKLTQKEINRRKLAEARRQDAIKYGEEYIEDEDE